jgi:hypothetical protein
MAGVGARPFATLATHATLVPIEELVPADHSYRHVDRVLDLLLVHELVQSRYFDNWDRSASNCMR